MLREYLEPKWVATFARNFTASGIGSETLVAILCETQSRRINIELARQALQQLGARTFLVELTTPKLDAPVAIRSTGASDAIQGLKPVIDALAAADVVIDCTVEGLLHSVETPAILSRGARSLMISNEHPEVFERLGTDPDLEREVRAGVQKARSAAGMNVTSAAGTDLDIRLGNCRVGGGWGYCAEPGTQAHWPGGLVAASPNAGSVNGRIVFMPGDANLTFKRYFEGRVELELRDDFIVEIRGDNLDAELMRSYLEAWKDPSAYAVSHVGWGLNRRARWDSLVMYDRKDVNGTELRCFAGNFLFSCGANEHAGRYTKGHFDLPMRNCTVTLDGEPVVEAGVLRAL